MTIAKVDLQNSSSSAVTGWNGLAPTRITDMSLNDVNGDPTGWTIRYEDGFTPSEPGGDGYNGVGVGDAAWVDSADVMNHSTFGFGDPGAKIILTGPDEILSLKCTSSYGNSGIATDVLWTVNGTLTQVINSYDSANARAANDTAAVFANVQKNGSGVFEITFTGQSATRGYATALYIETAPGPSLTVTQTELTPGGTVSGTFSDYDTIPTKLEGIRGSNSIGTDTGEITGLTINETLADGKYSGTWSATLPGLPTSGTASFLRFSDLGAGIADPTWRLS